MLGFQQCGHLLANYSGRCYCDGEILGRLKAIGGRRSHLPSGQRQGSIISVRQNEGKYWECMSTVGPHKLTLSLLSSRQPITSCLHSHSMCDVFASAGHVLYTTKSFAILRIFLAVLKTSPVFCTLECLCSSTCRTPLRCSPSPRCVWAKQSLHFWAARIEASLYDCITVIGGLWFSKTMGRNPNVSLFWLHDGLNILFPEEGFNSKVKSGRMKPGSLHLHWNSFSGSFLPHFQLSEKK